MCGFCKIFLNRPEVEELYFFIAVKANEAVMRIHGKCQ